MLSADDRIDAEIIADAIGLERLYLAEIKDWGSDAEHGVARLRVGNVAVARAVAAMPSKALPADRLHPVGSASGTVDVAWRGSPSRFRHPALLRNF